MGGLGGVGARIQRGPLTPLRARPHRVTHSILVLFLAMGLMAALVVDADGDPTTVNVPSVVLSVETSESAEDAPNLAESGSDDSSACSWSRSLIYWLSELLQPRHNARRVLPIRGP